MAELIQMSLTGLEAIPADKRFELHHMYEDSDIDGAQRAEEIVTFTQQEAPDIFIGVLANDSVTPPCCSDSGHYNCDHYDPHWYIILIAASTWEQYKEAVTAKDQAWKDAHGCKVVRQEGVQ